MKQNILFMDDDKNFLSIHQELLEDDGFNVFPALSIDEARSILRTKNIHLGIYDVKMKINEPDESGLEFAKEIQFFHLPKVIFTAYPSFSHFQEIMGRNENGFVPAIAYIPKDDGYETLKQTIDRIFANDIKRNENLKIEFSPTAETNWFHLTTGLITPGYPMELDQVSEELRDLLRKLFYEFEQITINRMIGKPSESLLLDVSAFKNHVEMPFVVTLGLKTKLDREKSYFNQVSKIFTDIRFQSEAYTLHFAAHIFSFPGTELFSAVPFSSFLFRESDKNLRSILQTFFEKLVDTRQVIPAGVDLDIKERATSIPLEYPTQDITDVWNKILEKVNHELHLRKWGGINNGAENHIFVLENGEKRKFPNLLLTANKINWHETNAELVECLGLTNLDSIYVSEQKLLLFRFENAGYGYPLQDFCTLENALRFDPLMVDNFICLENFERVLFQQKSWIGSPNTSDVEPAYRKTLTAIQTVRNLAAEMVSADSGEYARLMFQQIFPDLVSLDFEKYLSTAELLHWVHRFIVCGYLAIHLEENTSPHVKTSVSLKADQVFPLEFNKNKREVVIGNQCFPLTKKEAMIISYLVENKGKVCSIEEILVQGMGEKILDMKSASNTLANNIRRIRQKIEKDLKNPVYILNIPGEGYYLDDPK